jgi:precorrin-6B methylase 2
MSDQWTRERVLKLAGEYKTQCVLAAAAELDLFGAMGDRSFEADEVVRSLSTDARGTAILLDALVAIGLLIKERDVYRPAAGTVELLTESSAHSVLAMVRHQANCIRRWGQLAQVVRSGRPAERVPSIRGAAADQESFIRAMDNISAPVAHAIVAELGPLSFRRLLDVGGASGTWTLAFLRQRPEATAIIFDLPEVCPLAKQRIADADLADRVSIVGGDFERDPLPDGVDLVWLSAIVHQNSREQNRRLFAGSRDALVAGGRLLIRDIVMDDSRVYPPAGALFAVNMLVATEGGGTFTLDELRDDLEASGFKDVSLLRHDPEWMHSVVQAQRVD